MTDPRYVYAVIFGDPGPARANQRLVAVNDKHGKAQLVGRKKGKNGKPSPSKWSIDAATTIRKDAGPGVKLCGAVVVSVSTHWPRQHRQGPAAGLALGDVDATIKSVLDAIEASGVIDDDAQIIHCDLAKFIDAKNPRITIHLVERSGVPS